MGPLGHSVALLAALAGAPVGIGALALRPSWRKGVGQRLGAAPRVAPGGLWIHGASVGEIRAALPLMDGARAAGHAVLASAMTQAGLETLGRERPGMPATLAPLDHPWCVSAALGRAEPAALVLVETELWPCWIAAAARRGIPAVLVSGRLSERSVSRYRRLRPLLGDVFGRLSAVGARSEEDAARFALLGVPRTRIEVTGDLKLEPPPQPPALAPDLARALQGTTLFVAGSTHEGEETAALEAFAAARRLALSCTLVLAPRRPERAGAAAAEAARAGHPVIRRSALADRLLKDGDVLVLDGLGDLPALYPLARVAFVGGTLAPVGGHNLLEPAHAAVPVLHGPFLDNVGEASRLLGLAGAARRVADAQDLGAALCHDLRHPQEAAARGAAGRAAVAAHRGSAARSLALVERTLAAARGAAA